MRGAGGGAEEGKGEAFEDGSEEAFELGGEEAVGGGGEDGEGGASLRVGQPRPRPSFNLVGTTSFRVKVR